VTNIRTGSETSGGARSTTEAAECGLTRRELEVLRLLATGVDTATLSAQLEVSRSTVRNHLQHIFGKLGVHGRLQAVAYYYGERDGERAPAVPPAAAANRNGTKREDPELAGRIRSNGSNGRRPPRRPPSKASRPSLTYLTTRAGWLHTEIARLHRRFLALREETQALVAASRTLQEACRAFTRDSQAVRLGSRRRMS
jgi:DNA-binding CsgD family transcriptional regulator